MSVKSLLLWEKWRPKKFEDIILIPRIRKQFESGISQHYIFYGHYGSGKTSLARILIGKYSKDTPYLELNCSMDTSIDVLRSEIDTFCKVRPMMDVESEIKYVFLDEFERVSPQFQDAFKAFIEKYNNKVRFIICTNHINKISEGIKSRIKSINFDCIDLSEEKFIKIELFKRISNLILPSEKKQISKENLISIINKTFPDFRGVLVEVQNFLETGDNNINSSNISNSLKFELFNLVFSKSNYNETYQFVLKNFGPDKVDILMKQLGKPFIDFCIENNKSIDKLFECNFILADYSDKLDKNTDPIVLAMTIIGKFQLLLSE
jgi:DNA polymerase III delta prime subunit